MPSVRSARWWREYCETSGWPGWSPPRPTASTSSIPPGSTTRPGTRPTSDLGYSGARQKSQTCRDRGRRLMPSAPNPSGRSEPQESTMSTEATTLPARTGTVDPVRAVSVISTGSVEIHPEHSHGSKKPLYWWLLTSRQWLPPRPINVYVVEHARRTGVVRHRPGPRLGDGPVVLPRRIQRRRLRPAGQIPHRRARDSRRATGHPRVLDRRRRQGGHLPPAPGPHRRDPPTRRQRAPHHCGGVGPIVRVRPRGTRLPPRAYRRTRRALEPHQLRPDHRPGTLHRSVRRDGRRSIVLLPTPGHTPGSISMLVRRRDLPPLLMVGDLTYEAGLLERRQLPGVGDRGQLTHTTDRVLALAEHLPGLVILPAHDPTAAQRLVDSARRPR